MVRSVMQLIPQLMRYNSAAQGNLVVPAAVPWCLASSRLTAFMIMDRQHQNIAFTFKHFFRDVFFRHPLKPKKSKNLHLNACEDTIHALSLLLDK